MDRHSTTEGNKKTSIRPVWHYIDGSFVLEKDACVSALDVGLLRGYGVFDYVQVHEGLPFHLIDHLLRLKWSCEQVQLPLPATIDEMYDLVKALIEKNETFNAGIRLVVTGGPTSNDLLLPGKGSSLMILHHPYVPIPERYYTQGMRVVTTNMLRLLPSVKTTNYMPAIFSMRKAKEREFDDALYLNSKQEILEGTTCNVFFFKNGTWITPDSEDLVKGITRAILLDLAKANYPIEYRAIHISEIQSCEEAFVCSSVKDVVPLVQIDDQKVGSGIPGPHTASLRETFRKYMKNYFSQSHFIEQKIAKERV